MRPTRDGGSQWKLLNRTTQSVRQFSSVWVRQAARQAYGETFQYNYNLGLAIQPSLAQGFGLAKQFLNHMVLATPLGLAIQPSLGGAGDTIGSGNSAQFGSGNSIRMVLATPLGQAIQLSLGGAGDTFGHGNSDKFGSGNSISSSLDLRIPTFTNEYGEAKFMDCDSGKTIHTQSYSVRPCKLRIVTDSVWQFPMYAWLIHPIE